MRIRKLFDVNEFLDVFETAATHYAGLSQTPKNRLAVLLRIGETRIAGQLRLCLRMQKVTPKFGLVALYQTADKPSCPAVSFDHWQQHRGKTGLLQRPS